MTRGKREAAAMPPAMSRAIKRVGATGDTERQARWLIEWGNRDPETVPDATWDALGWDLTAFLWSGARSSGPVRETPQAPLDPETVRACWAEIRAGLESLVREGRWDITIPETVRTFWLHGLGPREPLDPSSGQTPKAVRFWGYRAARLHWTLNDPARREPAGHGFVSLKPDYVGQFRIQACEVLQAQAHRFRVCSERGCGRPFIARKRQVFCGKTCSQNYRTREWRRKHPESVRKARRRAYETSMRKRYGEKVRVLRRAGPRRSGDP